MSTVYTRNCTLFGTARTALFVLLLLSAWSTRTSAQETTEALPRSSFISYGFGICTTDQTSTAPDDRSPTGQTTYSEHFELIRQTARIKGVLGAHFGMEFMVQSATTRPIELTKVWVFPRPMRDPKTGREFRELRKTLYVTTNDRSFTTYQFDVPYEIVKGKWELQFLYNGTLVYKKFFEVY